MSIVSVWRRYLQVKVLSLIVAILVVGFGVLGVWNIRTQAAAVLEQHKEAARSLADAIVPSTERLSGNSFAPSPQAHAASLR